MTEIEIGRSKFLEKIREVRELLDRMEEEALEVSYKAKYEKLVELIEEEEAFAWRQLHNFPEPYQPDAIDDRKKVMQYRNDVFDHSYAVGELGACRRILKAVEES